MTGIRAVVVLEFKNMTDGEGMAEMNAIEMLQFVFDNQLEMAANADSAAIRSAEYIEERDA